VINAIKFSIEEIEASDQYFDHTGPLGNETRAWLDYLSTGVASVHTTPEQALVNQETTIAIEESVRTGQSVRLRTRLE
jgi:hypothetical protein